MRNLLANPEERVYFKDRDSRFLLVSVGWLRTVALGRSLDEVIGKTDFDIFSRPHAAAAFEDEQRVLETGEPMLAKIERETFHDRPDAWVSTTKLPLLDSRGKIIGTWGISRDVTAQVAAEQALVHQALHDTVTGLPNRVLFEDRLSQALTAARRHDRQLAVLFVDLDRFKNINDSLGHSAGDEVLRSAAMRLADCLRPEDTLARMGGDEFAAVLPEIGKPQDASLTAERLLSSLRRPLTLASGPQLTVTASIGIAVGSHEHLTTAEELTRNADLAMYASKSTGEGLVSFFAPSMHEKAVLRLALTSDLRRALDGGQFVVHYQPIVALDDGRIVGAEALVRWNHPQRGLIGPGVFIGLAEEAGLIGEIGGFVMRTACDQLARWRENPKWSRSFFMTVNVSRLQLRSSRFVADVEGVLQHAGLPPDRTVLEITESAVGDSRSDVSVRLAELKRLGVRLAVDDFGTGYSALSQLEDMPVDMLKIDKSFIDALGSAKQHDQLVDGIINLAHRMHLQTVAEGIETQEQATTLRRLGSDLGQGFHFAEPLPAEEFEALLQTPSAPDGPRQPPSPGRRRAGGRVAASTRH